MTNYSHYIINFYIQSVTIKITACIILFCFTGNIFPQRLVIPKLNSLIYESGISLEANYTGEYFNNIYGVVNNRSTHLHNIDLGFNLDLYKSVGWENSKLHAHILGNYGGEPNDYARTIQGISSIAAPNTWKIFEFWLEQKFFKNRFSILFGLYDLNSEFDVRESSSIFINPSHGIGPDFSLTGENGPSIFPTTSLALRLNYYYSDRFLFRTAIFDGIPGDLNNPNGTRLNLKKTDGLLVSTELNYFNNSEEIGAKYFKIGIGAWLYTKKLEIFSPISNNGKSKSFGFYAFAEKFFISERGCQSQGLSGFIRIGGGNQEVNQVKAYFGAGLNYIGLFPDLDEDTFGFAVAITNNSDGFTSAYRLKNPGSKINEYEFNFEISYLFDSFDYFQLQPDIQYIINPTFANNDTFVMGIRFKLIL